MPLIIHWPLTAASFPAWIDEPVSLLEVVPTILQFLGAQPPSQFQGRGLLGLGKQKFLKTAPDDYVAHYILGVIAVIEGRGRKARLN
ncbi:MAG: hypothetical protein ABSH01_17125 [Terriglobia bacterium]